jgi:hypothetical protein
MNTYKHSGTLGDLIYSLPIVKHFGGGDFYLHLNQIDWVGLHYYGSSPAPFHQGKMTQGDFEFMKSFMEAQAYITKFDTLTPQTEITHNMDRFRTAFVSHPGNYVDIYANTFRLNDPDLHAQLRNTPWLTVPDTILIPDRTIVINRTQRWLPKTLSPQWAIWKEQGLDSEAVFVGLPEEYTAFTKATGWDIPYQQTNTLLELAQYIAGCEQFIGNQSVALSLAIGLGVEWACEARDDMPLERNECYFKNHPNGAYF